MEKPDAPSCAKNREPILEVLRDHFHDRRQVLEIGSGTGQHAISSPSACRICSGKPRIAPKTCSESAPG
jgi:hypothetical protein